MVREPEVVDVNGRWEVISAYSTEQAVEDGVLRLVGYVEKSGDFVYFTTNLLKDYQDEAERRELVQRGLELLRQVSEEDTPCMKLRVIEKGEVWVIQEQGKLTFMKPRDY